jgi:hypothetical protein
MLARIDGDTKILNNRSNNDAIYFRADTIIHTLWTTISTNCIVFPPRNIMTDASKSNHYCPWIFLGHVTGQYYVEYTIPNLLGTPPMQKREV